jgi:hypothetical protein
MGAHAEYEVRPHWDGSNTTPLHRLKLLDEENQEILPSNPHAMPFSAKNTCGTCHDYDTVSSGFHFNSTNEGADSGRPGEPWIAVDEKRGVQLPLSYRGWEGTWNPDEIGIKPWLFTQLFGRHMPGGDAAEPADTLANPTSRWTVSGVAEVNCMACHNGSPEQDLSEWAKQMSRENYRWAATAASGLGEVGGMASRLPDMWTIHDGPNPDDHEFAVPPSVEYFPSKFDAKGRATFDITYQPLDENCLTCHSASPVNKHRWELTEDVHTAAGMKCADCHRNGLDHNIIRGYESETIERNDPTVAEFSCRGCHLGVPELEGDSLMAALGGRQGAMRPAHEGIPAIHFDKMSCTSCHSGPWPEDEPSQVRTSRANRLGIHGKARWYTDAPRIGEPIFMRDHDGKLAPYRMMWPAFWARIESDKVTPLLPDQVSAATTGILDAQEQIGTLLGSFSTGLAAFAELYPDLGAPGQAVFLTPGTVYRVNIDGGLDAAEYSGELNVPVSGLWAQEKDGVISALVPEFDPTAEMLDLAVEDIILKTVEWLAPYADPRGEPVATLGNKIYKKTPDDYFEAIDRTNGTADTLTWGWLKDDEINPIAPDFVVRAVTDTTQIDESINEEQVALVLDALTNAHSTDDGEAPKYAYISSGKMFTRDTSRGVVASDHPSAKPYAWPLAHNVRPASQSLGARACTDCHAKEAPIYFATVTAKGPLMTASASVIPAIELHGDEESPYIYTSKFFTWLIIITMTLLVLHILLDLMRRLLNSRAK